MSLWKQRQKNDPYVKKSKSLNLLSRAVFKLQEIQEKEKLFIANDVLLDFGSAPGSWSNFLIKKLNKHGLLISVDIKACPTFANNHIVLREDIHAETVIETLQVLLKNRKAGAIFSDMAPNISGIKESDNMKAYELAHRVVDIALEVLRLQGTLLIKLFEAPDRTELVERVKGHFSKIKIIKPKASRAKSREVYLLCLNYGKMEILC